MKYNIGDIVIIKKDLRAGAEYERLNFAIEMMQYCGKQAKIVGINENNYYILDIAGDRWSWNDPMLEDIDYTREQSYLYSLVKNSKSIYGIEVKSIKNPDGSAISKEHIGIVIGADHPPSNEVDLLLICEWDNGFIINTPLSCIEPIGLEVPKDFDPMKEIFIKIRKDIESDWAAAKSEELKDIDSKIEGEKRNIATAESSLQTYQKKIALYKANLKDYEKIKETAEVPDGEKGFKEEIENIKKLELVEKIYISKKQHIVIITKNITPFKLVDDVEVKKEQDIGAFTITIMPKSNTVKIINRTYTSHGYEHPHVRRDSIEICFGENRTTMYSLLRTRQYFSFVSFLLTFLSSWNVVGAGPYINYSDWDSGRSPTGNEHRGEEPVLFDL